MRRLPLFHLCLLCASLLWVPGGARAADGAAHDGGAISTDGGVGARASQVEPPPSTKAVPPTPEELRIVRQRRLLELLHVLRVLELLKVLPQMELDLL